MFRQKAIDSRKIKWQGDALLLPAIPVWLVSMFSLFFFIILLLFVIFGSYTRRVNVSGEITTYPRDIRVYSPVQGYITQKFVTEGQKVKQGDSLYLIDVSRTTRNGIVSAHQRQNIERQINNIDLIIAQIAVSKQTALDLLLKQKNQYSEALGHSSAIIDKAEEGVRLMKDNMENYQRYQKRGLINKDQLTNQTALYYQQQNSLLNLRSQNEQNFLQITYLESQIQTQATEFDNRIYQMELQKYELQKELTNNDAGENILIRALSEGVIDSLSVTEGQMINVGDSLLQIIPETIQHYYLVLWVPNNAVPYINKGDSVNIKYEAFPVEKFGQFAGRVAIVSKTPASAQEMMTYQGAPHSMQKSSIPFYKVVIKPEKKEIAYQGKNLTLENGMKGQSILFLEKRKIYQWMFSPFYDVKQSIMGPINE